MNLLPKPLQTENFYYTSDKSIQDLRFAAQQLIKESETLTGKFTSENEFYLYPTYLQSGKELFYSYKESSICLLGGEIYRDGYACLKITVRPSSNLRFCFFLFLLGATFINISIFKENPKGVWLVEFLPSALVILISYLLKKWLRNKVVKELELTPKL